MELAASDGLTEQEVRRGLKMVIRDGVASQAMGVLTSGAFLVAFAVNLGASNFVIGLLAAIGPLSQLLQLPSIVLVEKIRHRRAIVLFAAALARVCWLCIALIPLLIGTQAALAVLLVLLVVNSSLGAVAGCSWNSWMRDLIPEKILGSFFSRRMQISVGVGILVSLAAAAYLDLWREHFPQNETAGYSALFAAGFGLGIVGLFFLRATPEVKMHGSGGRQSLLRLIGEPFRDENFRKLMAFLCSWNFAVNLAAPFFMVYMLKRLGLSMSAIIALSILSQVMNFVFLRVWGRFADHFSNKSVLAVCGPLFIFSILAWTFTTMPERYFLTIPLLVAIHAVMGLSSAGVSLASGNISLKLAPKGRATAYLATNTITNSIAAGLAPILGGTFADLFAQRQLDWTLKYTAPGREFVLPTLNLQQWDFFFALAFIFGLYSIHRLSMVKEAGEVEEKVVVNELFNEVRGQVRILSSVEGLRQMVAFPFSILRSLAGNNKATSKESNDDSELGY